MDREMIYRRAGEYVKEEQNPVFRKEVEDLIAAQNDAELTDRFYQSLEFGTGGLRGIIGGGTNRMNTFMINRATQGLANYICKTFPEKAAAGRLSAAVAFDSRHYSDVFAEATALILAANGFTAYLFTGLRPTPELSFAIRTLGCDTGVVVTAPVQRLQSLLERRRAGHGTARCRHYPGGPGGNRSKNHDEGRSACRRTACID